jgi:phenylalanyl-tRNA synthetase alpha chain
MALVTSPSASSLSELCEQAFEAFSAATTEEQLYQAKSRFLGKSGGLAERMRQMRELTPEERPAFGQAVNDARAQIERLLEQALEWVRAEQIERRLRDERLDLTLPPRGAARGTLHPLRLAERRILRVFEEMGYAVAEGPQLETDFHNFTALNFPDDHPARDEQDSFVLPNGHLLRTHTSPVQVRTLLANEPPLRIAAPGAVFRVDTADMTHSPHFHQVEGLVVDEGISMADLKGSLQEFVRRLFGKDLRIRLRPSFFPFTEPSVEVDVECPFCSDGCRVCKGTRFIEILGAGLVDPNVFTACGVDAERFTGFAFGIGVERVAMLLFGVDDLRLFFENDLRFLRQFPTVE